MSKRIPGSIFVLLLLAGALQAATARYSEIRQTLQPQTTAYGVYLGSGTIQNLNTSTLTVTGPENIRGSTVTYSPLSIINGNKTDNSTITFTGAMRVSSFTATANLSMGNKILTQVATGTASGHAANFDQLYTFAAPVSFSVAIDSAIAPTDTAFTRMGTKVTITMGASTRHVYLIATGVVRNNTAGGINTCTLFRDSTNLGDVTAGMASVTATLPTPMTLAWLDAPGDTSAHVYEVYCKSNGTGAGHWGDGKTVFMMGWEVK